METPERVRIAYVRAVSDGLARICELFVKCRSACRMISSTARAARSVRAIRGPFQRNVFGLVEMLVVSK